ncbi:short-chain dehydrogenase [Sphingomonas sp. Leaf17]|uniref:SDR family NAD(P)-dependent oxidoreductase n=1 Tax=Sphingomonas sp. Leaf17 TaxID=1735683 RepID=UPI0006F4C133|nr:SDR family oxidoreductase [Sphingomonas sp. Leaf17]KQM67733.1 short-chain dehydrogenase [Sphingomonas sp. Leaf17]
MTTTLITGASAGLGEGFATTLAARGDTLILTARRADRLEVLAARLRATHGVSVTVIPTDLADPAAPADLTAAIAAAGLSVDLLVNNAGYGARGDFADLDGAMQTGMIDLNCRALVALSHAVLPAMIAKRAGGILNVASIAAFQPGPWMSVYYATKAFVLSFSEGLHEEVKHHGVHVSALCPGPTRTEFADVAGMADSALFQRFASDSDAVVRDGLAAIAANRAVAVSGRMNALTAGGVRFMPRGVARRLAGRLQRARQR